MESHFEVIFQPPYSSEANAQETVWSLVKAKFLIQLYRRETNLTTQQQFHNFVTRVLDDASPSINQRQVVKAPNWWLHAH